MPPIETGWEWFVKVLIEGVLVAFLVGVWIERFNRRSERRHEFRVAIELVVNRIEFADDAAFLAAYKTSVDEVRTACLKFEANIRRNKRTTFRKIWNEYCGLKDEDLRGAYQVTNPADMTPLLTIRFAFAKRNILRLLHRLIAFAG